MKQKTTFLYGHGENTKYEDAKVVIMSAPYDLTASYMKGTAEGPQAILKASNQVEFYDIELGTEIGEVGIHTLPEMQIQNESPEKMIQIVKEQTTKVLKDKKFPIMLGGEHSVTIGSFFAFHETYPTISVLQLDAHGDFRSNYEGSPYNHACVMYQIRQKIKNTISVGVRSADVSEYQFAKKDNAIVYFDINLQKEGIPVDRIVSELSDQVYITIDLDAFDPSFIPSVGTPEPGGLQWYPALDLLRTVFKKKNVVGCDVVELCPNKNAIASDFVAAKLVCKLIGYKFLM